MGHSPVNGRLLPSFLALACLAPVGFGSFKAVELISGSDFTLRFAAEHVDNLPLFLHVTGAGAFLVLGALQILPGFRHRHRLWHRRAGKLAIFAGLLGAFSGLWMTLAHPDISGPTLFWGRVAASGAWAAFILLAVRSIALREFRAHGRWMIRAYSMALPAGTLAFILFPMVLFLGEEGHDMFFEIVQVVAWPLHLAVAEWIMRKRHSPQPSAPEFSQGVA